MMDGVNSPAPSNREIVTNILERDIGNLYMSLRDSGLSMLDGQPILRKVVESYINSYQDKWMSVIQEKLDAIIEASFIDPRASVEQALSNASELINAAIGGFLEKHLGLPLETISVCLNGLIK